MTTRVDAVPPSPEGDSRRHWLDFALLLLAASIALVVLQVTMAGRERGDFKDPAMREAVNVFADLGGHRIHCQYVEDAGPCLEGHVARGRRPSFLWLANSQIQSVNQYQEGEENAPIPLFRHLDARGVDLLTFTQPNANLQEHLVLFAYLLPRARIEHLLLPLVFDDLRETGIRDSLVPALKDEAVQATLGRHDIGQKLLARHADMADPDIAALDQTIQEGAERALNGWLESHSEVWTSRPFARFTLFKNLHVLRNTVFRIDPTSKRRVIPGRRVLNLAALRALLEEARNNDVRPLLYIAPLRDDVEPPYDMSQYARFKRDVEAIAEDYDASFHDLGKLVPARFWGQQVAKRLGDPSQIDFMHFQAGGHSLLAERLANLADALLEVPAR